MTPNTPPARSTILIIDDDTEILESLSVFLQRHQYATLTAGSGSEGVERFRLQHPDLVLSDIRMPDMSGVEVLDRIKSEDPDAIIILMTGYSTISGAVEAIKRGAEQYVTKPLNPAELHTIISKCMQKKRLMIENAHLRQIALQRDFSEMIGQSPAFNHLIEEITKLSNANVNVLIQGESGVGKELTAAAIHRKSPRSAHPFIAINCAAIPGDLLESELFGHEKGAFSGATQKKFGLFEMADGGVVFLDEIGEMPPALQAKLLRVIESKRVRHIGGTREIPVDFRVICSTNRDLQHEVRENRFRKDLYYRLAGYQITVPPLRERKADIPLLINHFLKARGDAEYRPDRTLIDTLQAYHWPGNIRELENVLERLHLHAAEQMLMTRHLPPEIREKSGDTRHSTENTEYLPLCTIEKRHILAVYHACGGNKVAAAKILGIGLKTLYRKLDLYETA